MGSHGRIYAFWAFAFLLLLLASLFLRHTVSAVLTSLAIAYLVNPLLKYLEARGFPRGLSLVLLYGILVVGCFYSTFFLIPYVGQQLQLLTLSLPGYVKNLQEAAVSWQRELSRYYSAEDVSWLVDRSVEVLNQAATDVSGKGYERLKGLGFALFDLLLAPILVFFLLYYKEVAKKGLMRLVPEGYRDEITTLGNRINRTLERFLYAMFIDCFLVGILCSLSLYLMGIEFPILNGMIAGFATIIPFFGAMLAVIPPALIGYLKGGDLMIIPKVCAVYFIINTVVEGTLIKPLLMRSALQLNPLAVIFALMALGEIMGFWGVVLAVPLTAVVQICSEDIHGLMLGGDDGGTGQI
ncbi:MAG: AI-2E family transporter [Geobacter sp.]|nr:AI-2E family transporter [Geobacter sp.]